MLCVKHRGHRTVVDVELQGLVHVCGRDEHQLAQRALRAAQAQAVVADADALLDERQRAQVQPQRAAFTAGSRGRRRLCLQLCRLVCRRCVVNARSHALPHSSLLWLLRRCDDCCASAGGWRAHRPCGWCCAATGRARVGVPPLLARELHHPDQPAHVSVKPVRRPLLCKCRREAAAWAFGLAAPAKSRAGRDPAVRTRLDDASTDDDLTPLQNGVAGRGSALRAPGAAARRGPAPLVPPNRRRVRWGSQQCGGPIGLSSSSSGALQDQAYRATGARDSTPLRP